MLRLASKQGRKRVHNADEIMARSSPSAWWSTWSARACRRHEKAAKPGAATLGRGFER